MLLHTVHSVNHRSCFAFLAFVHHTLCTVLLNVTELKYTLLYGTVHIHVGNLSPIVLFLIPRTTAGRVA